VSAHGKSLHGLGLLPAREDVFTTFRSAVDIDDPDEFLD
jgi:hypothetical protein